VMDGLGERDQRPPMPREVAIDLLARYRAVPKVHDKYRTPAGADFLIYLEDIVTVYGTAPCRRALGMSESGLAYIRRKRMRPLRMPTESRVAELRAAIAKVDKIRRLRPEYEVAHELLMEILDDGYEIALVAKALGMRVDRLERFARVPEISSIGRRKLADAMAVLAAAAPHLAYHQAVRAGEDPRQWPDFIRAVQDAAPYVSERRMAEYFEMTLEAIRGLLSHRAG
jgi:hypothetical protein